MNDVRDRGRVEQCLKDHVTEKKITADSNKECFAVMSEPSSLPPFKCCFLVFLDSVSQSLAASGTVFLWARCPSCHPAISVGCSEGNCGDNIIKKIWCRWPQQLLRFYAIIWVTARASCMYQPALVFRTMFTVWRILIRIYILLLYLNWWSILSLVPNSASVK